MNYIVVTNTYRRDQKLVERSLQASLSQKIKPFKVILIDQNKPALKISEDIISNSLFEKQETEHKAVSKARNSLRIPNNIEWIVFCDDDGYLAENYSEKLQEIINTNKQIEILAGNILREDTKTNYTIRQKGSGSLKYFRYTKKLMGSNFVTKVSVFEELGRFDPDFGAGSFWGSGEETDFCWKAFFDGVKMEFFRELIVYHVPPFQESVKAGFKKSFNYGVGKGALVWKWLFKKGKLIVLYEFLEMTLIPFVQMIRGIFTFKFQLIPNNIATLAGRYYGLIKASLIKK